MWETGWREQIWSQISEPWDLLIIGGGITGAGILREASRAGLRALLVEAHDFASGTSSRSSKLVHGGFRYLKNGQIKLIYESVRERERLLKEGRGLVSPLGFLLANYRGDSIPAGCLVVVWCSTICWPFNGATAIMTLMICTTFAHRCPRKIFGGGYRYFDAQTDDARLVLRLIQESVHDGGTALNYTRAIRLLRTRQGQVCGAALQDETPENKGRSAEVQARLVINATGAWADDLRLEMGERARLRRLRGSHLILPARRLPLTRSVSFLHPLDNRPVFAFPWEGVTLIGTTDVEMDEPLTHRPSDQPGGN